MSTPPVVRWGVIGPGSIARTVGADIARTPGAQLTAVASRSTERAAGYAREFDIDRSFGNYEHLLEAGGIDIVYVATPHAQHHAVVAAALQRGVPVLCEKAFTVTLPATLDLVQQAATAGVFCVEAVWMRFNPVMVRLRHLVASGVIGEVRSVHAGFGLAREFDPASRLWDPGQGGGSLLDLGTYPVNFAHQLLGAPSGQHSAGTLAPSGVDAEASLLLTWPQGQAALLQSSLRAPLEDRAVVIGTGGRIEVHSRFHEARAMTVHVAGAEPDHVTVPIEGNGYVPMIRSVQSSLLAGAVQDPLMPLQATVEVMTVLDTALTELGATRADEGFTAAPMS